MLINADKLFILRMIKNKFRVYNLKNRLFSDFKAAYDLMRKISFARTAGKERG